MLELLEDPAVAFEIRLMTAVMGQLRARYSRALRLFKICFQLAARGDELLAAAVQAHGLGEHGARAELRHFLRKMADGQVFGFRDRTEVRRLEPQDHLDQRGLAGAVRPDQRNTRAGSDKRAGVFEEDLRAVLL